MAKKIHFKDLTKRDLRHVSETTQGGTLREFKINAAQYAKWRKTTPCEPCSECRRIATKLGLPV